MGVCEFVLSTAFFAFFGTLYVAGYNFFKKRNPEHLVRFYLILAVFRIMIVATVILLYTLTADSRPQAIHFAMMFIAMYVVMMIITLTLKH
jgi:hypothetical protein